MTENLDEFIKTRSLDQFSTFTHLEIGMDSGSAQVDQKSLGEIEARRIHFSGDFREQFLTWGFSEKLMAKLDPKKIQFLTSMTFLYDLSTYLAPSRKYSSTAIHKH